MLRYNSRRKKEFMAVQAQLDADSLAAARLAFMRGEATPEQTAMVEAAQQKEAGSEGEAIFKMPSLLGAPAPIAAGTDGAAAAAEEEEEVKEADKPSGGLRSWFSSTLSREEQGEAAGSSDSRLGYESLSEEDDAQGLRESDVVRALEQKQKAAAAAYQAVTERAQQALEREKANQREGGPLDRIGLDESKPAGAAAAPASKKSWW